MNEYDYKGYTIIETSDGYYQIGDFEFPSLDDAMDWVDDMETDTPAPAKEPKLHTYLFFYVDRATDAAFEAKVVAKDLSEAKKILRQNYDVYSIADYYVLD